MAQVNSENSIAAPAGLARRAFVAALAGGAAAAIVAPAPALASGDPDPVFELIEAHREAAWKYAAAVKEQSRREQILMDEGIGLCPFVVMVGNGRPMVAYTHKQIDTYWGAVTDQVMAKAHSDLDATLKRYDEVFGNAEDEAGKVGDAALDAFVDLISTPPTTASGARALLDYLLEDVADLGQQFLEEDRLVALLSSLNETLQDIHPVQS